MFCFMHSTTYLLPATFMLTDSMCGSLDRMQRVSKVLSQHALLLDEMKRREGGGGGLQNPVRLATPNPAYNMRLPDQLCMLS